MDNDQAVRWTDDVSSSYIFVPNIDLKFRLIPAMLASGLGLMLGGWPIAVSAAFYLLMPPEAHQAEGFSMGLLAPIPFFGVILFPISGWLLARSILMLAGKTRLSIEDGVVHRRTSWGPLW